MTMGRTWLSDMDDYQQKIQIETNRIIRGTRFYSYPESLYFSHEIHILRENIENYLLYSEPDLALEIIEKIIRADGRIIERVDDSDGSVLGLRVKNFGKKIKGVNWGKDC